MGNMDASELRGPPSSCATSMARLANSVFRGDGILVCTAPLTTCTQEGVASDAARRVHSLRHARASHPALPTPSRPATRTTRVVENGAQQTVVLFCGSAASRDSVSGKADARKGRCQVGPMPGRPLAGVGWGGVQSCGTAAHDFLPPRLLLLAAGRTRTADCFLGAPTKLASVRPSVTNTVPP